MPHQNNMPKPGTPTPPKTRLLKSVLRTPTRKFVTDPARDDVIRDPKRLEDVKAYVRNAATWLASR